VTPRSAPLLAALVLALVGCANDDDVPREGAPETRSAAALDTALDTALDAAVDRGPEVVDGVLYPPGVPVGESGAVGRTRTGWTVSGGGNSGSLFGSAAVYADDGALVTEGRDVLGVAFSDPTGDLAAWVEARNDGDVRHLVVVDTSTGEHLLRQRLDGGSVDAVWGEEVVVSGDYAAGKDGKTYALTVDGDQELLPVPGDSILWGFDGEHLAYGDFDHRVTVVDRGGGNAHDYDALVAFLSPGTGKVALLGADGLAVVDVETGERVSLPVEEPSMYTQWTPAGDLVVWTGGIFGEQEPQRRYVCLGGTPDCHPAPAIHPGDEVRVSSADALTNLFAQLS